MVSLKSLIQVRYVQPLDPILKQCIKFLSLIVTILSYHSRPQPVQFKLSETFDVNGRPVRPEVEGLADEGDGVIV